MTNAQHPVYIPTKGRSAFMITSKALTALGVPHFLVVEPQEVDAYQDAVAATGVLATVLTLDLSLKEKYQTCDDLGLSKSTGPGPARNFAWQHAKASGAAWHWVMDDNLRGFFRLNKNLKVPVSDGTIFRCMEDFCGRYANIAMAGPNYFMFASRKHKSPPFVANTRIYSCNLIRNDVPFAWRGRYNEDTILSLDMLKAGWCTVLFNAFLQEKMETQKLPGGNTDDFYLAEGVKRPGEKYADTGTVAKSKMLCDVHPDVSRMAWRFRRWHHYVNYDPFKQNKLILRDGVKVEAGIDNYGMALKAVPTKRGVKK